MGQYFIGATKKVNTNESLRIFNLYKSIYAVLRSNGYPESVIPLVIAQAFHETNYGNDYKAKANNWSGIKSYPNVFASHKKYGKVGSYVAFPNINAWAIELRDHYLNQNKGLGKPIDAKDYNDYARRLKANKYFSDSLLTYTTGLQRALQKINSSVKTYSSNQGSNQSYYNQPMFEKFTITQPAKSNNFVYDQSAANPNNVELMKYLEKQNESDAKKNFWDIEKWSTSNKIFAAVGTLAALAIITRK